MAENISIASGTPSAIRQHYYSRKIKMYLFVILLITVWMGFYGVEKYFELSEKSAITKESDRFIQDINASLETDRDERAAVAESNAALFENMDREIAKVFPPTEEYTDLTRLLDDFFKQNNLAKNPIVATDLQFDQPLTDAENQYTILPFSINIESSERNFYKFLSFIESSGSLKGKIRLMDINSIQLNFPGEEETSGPKKIRFNAKLRAYSEKTADD